MAQDVISSVRTVFSFGAESFELERYGEHIERYFVLVVRQTCIQAAYFMICNTFLVNTCVQGGILLYGIKLIHDGQCTVNILLAFMLYQGMLQEYCQNLFNSFTSLLKSSGAAAKGETANGSQPAELLCFDSV